MLKIIRALYLITILFSFGGIWAVKPVDALGASPDKSVVDESLSAWLETPQSHRAYAQVKTLIEFPEIRPPKQPLLSPDGESVLAFEPHVDFKANTTGGSWALFTRLSAVKPEVSETLIPETASALRWLSNHTIAFAAPVQSKDFPSPALPLGIWTYDIQDKKTELIWPNRFSANSPVLLGMIAWSPNMKRIAFVAHEPAKDAVWGNGRSYEAVTEETRTVASLYLYDIEEQRLEKLTDRRYPLSKPRHISDIAWGAKGENLYFLFEAGRADQPTSYGTSTDIARYSLTTQIVEAVHVSEGGEDSIRISPSGAYLSFSSMKGRTVYAGGWPAIKNLTSGVVNYPDNLSRGAQILYWSPDEKWLIARERRGFANPLVRIDPTSGDAQTIIGSYDPLANNEGHSFSQAGRVVFYRSSAVSPEELVLAEISADRRRLLNERILTSANERFPFKNRVSIELVRWKSFDGKYDLEGLLLKPLGESLENDGKFPTIVSIVGGPSQATSEFLQLGAPASNFALALAGYAVLAPTSRGRPGYGDEFHEAMAKEGSFAENPWKDVYSGLEYLVDIGFADPKRLGVIGHSYGGGLAGYGVTRTNLGGAVIGDPISFNHTWLIDQAHKGAYREHLARYIRGLRDRFDDVEQANLIRDSAAFHVDDVQTPTLLQCALHGTLDRVCKDFYLTLKDVGAPSALYGYDDEHALMKPQSQVNEIVRNIAWFDYWLAPDRENVARGE